VFNSSCIGAFSGSIWDDEEIRREARDPGRVNEHARQAGSEQRAIRTAGVIHGRRERLPFEHCPNGSGCLDDHLPERRIELDLAALARSQVGDGALRDGASKHLLQAHRLGAELDGFMNPGALAAALVFHRVRHAFRRPLHGVHFTDQG
jgi:hypothetical protein